MSADCTAGLIASHSAGNVDSRIMSGGIISSCQSAATSGFIRRHGPIPSKQIRLRLAHEICGPEVDGDFDDRARR